MCLQSPQKSLLRLPSLSHPVHNSHVRYLFNRQARYVAGSPTFFSRNNWVNEQFLGESNANYNQDFYGCTFKTMIEVWRNRWSQRSSSNGDFPFGFAQLATNSETSLSPLVPELRWHQTIDIGYAPNEEIPVWWWRYSLLISNRSLLYVTREPSWLWLWILTTPRVEFIHGTSRFDRTICTTVYFG